jgi:hypothetical protein
VRRVYLAITIAAMLLFGHALFDLARTKAPLHDDSYNAMVARNLVEGRGYRSGEPRARTFDPEITTGPLVVLPVALVMKLVGVSVIVPSVGAAIVSFGLFLLVLALVWRSGDLGPMVAAGLAVLVLGASETGGPTPYGFWHTMLGEVPGLLLAVSGLLLLFERDDEKKHRVGALLLGASLLCKIAFLLLVLGALATALLSRNRPVLRAARWLPLPFLAWQATQLLVLGPSGYAHQLASETVPFLLWSAGARAIGPLSVGGRLSKLGSLFGGWRGVPALLGLVGVTIVLSRGRARPPFARFAVALAAGSLVLVGWWIFRSPFSWPRQVYPAVLALELAVAAAALAVSHGRIRWLVVALLLLLAWRSPGLLFVPLREPAPRLSALRGTATFVDDLAREPGVVLISDGDEVPRDVALLLHARFSAPTTPALRRVMVRNEFTNEAADRAAQELAARCHAIFVREPFYVLDCP